MTQDNTREVLSGKNIEWMETAIDLAIKWADARSSDDPTSEVVAAFEAMRLHLLSALYGPGPQVLPAEVEHTLWVLAEHNALYFGENHNTVIGARAALQGATDHYRNTKEKQS